MTKEELQALKEQVSEAYAFGHGYEWLTEKLRKVFLCGEISVAEQQEVVTHLVTKCAFEAGRDHEFGLHVKKV